MLVHFTKATAIHGNFRWTMRVSRNQCADESAG